MKTVIAIDGPSGAGKSTIAKLIAKRLGYEYLDTGALYRAVALGLLRLSVPEIAKDEEIRIALNQIDVRFKNGKVFLNGDDVSQEIRSPEAGHFASVFSAKKPVRDHLLQIQRASAIDTDLVAEGRDMTTVIFPDADFKFFLDASNEERARRRTIELKSKGYEVDMEQVKLEITERDERDSKRAIAPLRVADDAYVIDSTGLSIEEVLNKIMKVIGGKKLGNHPC